VAKAPDRGDSQHLAPPLTAPQPRTAPAGRCWSQPGPGSAAASPGRAGSTPRPWSSSRTRSATRSRLGGIPFLHRFDSAVTRASPCVRDRWRLRADCCRRRHARPEEHRPFSRCERPDPFPTPM